MGMAIKSPPWSYSSLTKFETCPRQYYLTKVAKKVVEPPTEATTWGTRVHSALEDRINLKTPLPEGMEQWERIAARFDTPKGRVFTEQQIALTRNLTPTTWTADNCWCRGIIDLGVDAGERVTLLDWKTGKVKPDNDQLKLFAAFYMSAKPYVQMVRTGFVWLKHNKLTRKDFTRDDLPVIWEDFIMRSQRLDNAYQKDRWNPKTSGLCGWCPVGKDNCEFWSPKK